RQILWLRFLRERDRESEQEQRSEQNTGGNRPFHTDRMISKAFSACHEIHTTSACSTWACTICGVTLTRCGRRVRNIDPVAVPCRNEKSRRWVGSVQQGLDRRRTATGRIRVS